MRNLPNTVEAYIAACPEDVQPILHKLRQLIRTAAPQAQEKISWGMATYVYRGNLVHFSAQKNHLGFHPAPSGVTAFQAELSGYACSKGTIRIPYDKPLPEALLKKIIAFRIAEQDRLWAQKQAGVHEAQPAAAPLPLPDTVRTKLAEQGLEVSFTNRPLYQQNAYIRWITQAKRQETREKRLAALAAELQESMYMGKPYKTAKK